MRYLTKFELFESLKEIFIDGYKYVIQPLKMNFKDFDEDGTSPKYCKKSYVVINDGDGMIFPSGPYVGILNHISDDNNENNAFDPYNYSKDLGYIRAILDHGMECGVEDLYEIISTDNKDGKVYYKHLDRHSTNWNPEWTFGFDNGIFIHNDLKNKYKK